VRVTARTHSYNPPEPVAGAPADRQPRTDAARADLVTGGVRRLVQDGVLTAAEADARLEAQRVAISTGHLALATTTYIVAGPKP
jgi:hypothetical protein